MSLKIDEEFRALIPPLSKEEREQLEANLKSDGCRDPLVTWQGLIIDGHNRFEICTRCGIGFEKIIKQFDDRSQVIEWIIRNQFGRRNLAPYQRTILALRLEETIKDRAKANFGARTDLLQNSAKGSTPIHTREEIGKIAGVSRDTVDKVKQIERKATPEIKDALAKGEISINKAHATTKKTSVDEEFETVVVDESKNPKPKLVETNGMGIYCVAKSHMEKISSDDTERIKALESMISYCQMRIEKNK